MVWLGPVWLLPAAVFCSTVTASQNRHNNQAFLNVSSSVLSQSDQHSTPSSLASSQQTAALTCIPAEPLPSAGKVVDGVLAFVKTTVLPPCALSTTTTTVTKKTPCSTNCGGHRTLPTDSSPTVHHITPTTTTSPNSTSPTSSATVSANCQTLGPGDALTIYSLVPNTTTITIYGTSTYSPRPEFTPPKYCSTLAWGGHSSTDVNTPHHASSTATTTVIVTSKNPVVFYTTDSVPVFPPGGYTPTANPPGNGWWTVFRSSTGRALPIHSTAVPTPPPATSGGGGAGGTNSHGDSSGDSNRGGSGSPTTTMSVGNVNVVVGPGRVVIDGHTISMQDQQWQTTVWASGEPFTVNPSQVIAPGTIIAVPFSEPGAVTASAFPTGPTSVLVIGGEVVSAVGPSIAVIGDETFTYGPGSPPQTDVFNGETITIGPSGIELAMTTLGGDSNPTATLLGIVGGLTITEIGASNAVISGTVFTIGPEATPVTAVIDGRTITAGPLGLDLGKTTLVYPLNPTTQTITAGGVTLSEIGTSVVVILGTTYTIGPQAKTTSAVVYSGLTISIGPGGVGFPTTTVGSPGSPGPTATSTQKGHKNGVNKLRPLASIALLCMGLCVGILV